jgi:hypothetical protein
VYSKGLFYVLDAFGSIKICDTIGDLFAGMKKYIVKSCSGDSLMKYGELSYEAIEVIFAVDEY